MKKSFVKSAMDEINKASLTKYIQKKNVDIGEILSIETMNKGVFNDIYIIVTKKAEYVLRKEVKHQTNKMKRNSIDREYQIMSILNAYFTQVPTPILYCNDESIIGAAFFITEKKSGTVLNTKFIGNYSEEIGRTISEEMINLLVDLHSIDYKQTALKDMMDTENVLESHVEEWIEKYNELKLKNSPNIEPLIEWLRSEMPSSKYTSIIHGEFILNNVMFNNELTEIEGLFDFELTKVGDPLIDFAIMLSYWATEEDPMFFKLFYMKSPVTVLPGFYSQNEMIMRYAEKSGRDLSDLFYYRVFACFQLATMTQQYFVLYKEAKLNEDDYKWMPVRVENILNYASSLIKEKTP